MELSKRITINPEVMVGKPTIRGMRITVEQILNSLASNISVKDLMEDYPELELEDIKAALLYAAKLVEEEKVYNIGA
ncbi:MAG: DUF433 domain-containing protein [Ignavibacteria bacterium]|nr:DUF433 domain-containing protein [Ignavibacteria bacterium]